MATLESILETKLVAWSKAQGGVALKGATQFDTGYPDRIVYVPGAHAHVEVKGTSTRYHLNEKQKIWAGRIIASKSPYYILESEAQLEKLKHLLYTNGATLSVNTYMLNGFQLVLHIDTSTSTYSVVSYRDGTERRIMEGVVTDSVTNLVYRIFKQLEFSFPNTNYEDI